MIRPPGPGPRRNDSSDSIRLGRRPLGRRTLSTETIADRVATLLVDHIRRHRLPAGAALPSELQTSADLRVSRGVVREAYRSLSSAGWVDVGNGRAPRVGRISDRSLLQVVQHALWTDQASMEQILEVRKAIEERAAELAAVHRSAVELELLRRLVDDLRAASGKTSRIDAWVAADVHFHEVVGQATGNPLFALMTRALREAMGASIRAAAMAHTRGPDIIDAHARIVEAIARRRPREARRQVSRHYELSMAAVVRGGGTAAQRRAELPSMPRLVRGRRRT